MNESSEDQYQNESSPSIAFNECTGKFVYVACDKKAVCTQYNIMCDDCQRNMARDYYIPKETQKVNPPTPPPASKRSSNEPQSN